MTVLHETALVFAREVLNWNNALPDTVLGASMLRRKSNPLAEFFYTDLNDVMRRVREWCDTRRMVLDFSYSSANRSYYAWVELNDGYSDGGALIGEQLNEHPCQALMQACIESARKLKARA